MRAEAGATAIGWLVASASALLLVLSGCTPVPSEPTRSPTPQPTPLFASDEEALAAVEVAYGRYLAVSDAVGQSGYSDVSAASDVLGGDALKEFESGARHAAQAGERQVGASRYDSMSIQLIAAASVRAYVCLDVTDAHLVDRAGLPVENDQRRNRIPLEVGFGIERDHLVLEESTVWSGSDFC
jgi:hypothetical protein